MSDRDASELYEVIGQGLLDGAPADWVEAGVNYCSVGNVGSGEFFAILENGEKERFRVKGGLRAMDELRELFASPARALGSPRRAGSIGRVGSRSTSTTTTSLNSCRP
jgi:hypothetical protein